MTLYFDHIGAFVIRVIFIWVSEVKGDIWANGNVVDRLIMILSGGLNFDN